jgi:hypothetical protein
MLTESLDRVLDDVDPNTDRSTWIRFCEWIHSFHDVNIKKLIKYNDFSEFEKNADIELPLKYLESMKDLWIKWNKAVEADMARK